MHITSITSEKRMCNQNSLLFFSTVACRFRIKCILKLLWNQFCGNESAPYFSSLNLNSINSILHPFLKSKFSSVDNSHPTAWELIPTYYHIVKYNFRYICSNKINFSIRPRSFPREWRVHVDTCLRKFKICDSSKYLLTTR